MTDPRTTPLHERHHELGASFTDFGGWLMPVRYSSDLAEHHAVRRAAGLFDISHMAEFIVAGPDAAAFLDFALAGAISPMKVGRAKYSLVLAESGGIVDDVIVYRLADERFLVIANAGNRDAVAAAFDERSEGFAVPEAPAEDTGVVPVHASGLVTDVTDEFALLAVQGPIARTVVEATDGITGITPALADLGYYAWAAGEFRGVPLFVARTGYTGEDGFELLVPISHAQTLWDALLIAGQPHELVPAGLASRDTLRLEAGMPLYGHELSLDTVPAQAGLGRVVALNKDDFVGRSGLASVVAVDAPVLVGLASEGKRAGRAGYALYDTADGGEPVGEITSGALSPTLGHPIAMAYVVPRVAHPDTTLYIDVRGTRIPATVTALPFYRRSN
ncbi:glycine cleavage system aminomethyltransferase GcvT [Microbacterium sp. C7(2022)]|uniref:glycine cleavage system aminomethyltransferase GcvT n=1 Tax=Microbacterium sp. C7(2022) TaxID=2992759 RepID=UPI00237B3F7D|nr:glycine cleavage system aminomethyltransferase GcvT [Microbacterium sp. C7(2022)]MDE0545736.1 glycine cleavage system aminomethyltransferase GcvT [Microbacterium sp. C7(2022)]